MTFDVANFRGVDISGSNAKIHLDQHDPANKLLSLSSSFADAELKGRFDLDIIQAYLTQQIPNLFRKMAAHPTFHDTVVIGNEITGYPSVPVRTMSVDVPMSAGLVNSLCAVSVNVAVRLLLIISPLESAVPCSCFRARSAP